MDETDETIRLWDLQNYQCFHLLEGQTGGMGAFYG